MQEFVKLPGGKLIEITSMSLGEWVTLADLRRGAIFETTNGVRAVKSEYHYPSNAGLGQCECVLLESGEYGHFPNGNAERVREIFLP